MYTDGVNLLVVSPWFPAPPDNGSRLRAFHLLKAWRGAGHTIRLVAGLQHDIKDTADRAALEALCESVQVFPWRWHDGEAKSGVRTLLSPVPRSVAETDNPAMRDGIKAEFERKPDVCVAMELASAPLVPRDTGGVPVILEQVEVSGVARAVRDAKGVKARLQAALTRAKHDNYWRRELARFDAVTAVSDEEANAVRELLGGESFPVSVVPNGVDTAYYPRPPAPPVPGRMIYNGAITYPPNRDAVAWFLRDMMPVVAGRVPDAHLIVTGKAPPDAAARFAGESRVRFTGFVPDMRPVMADAAVCVVPLTVGGGTRLKVLEAWAAGVPVVSTTVGAVGLAGSVDGSHLLVADAPDGFAAACVRVLTEPELAHRIADNARALVASRYDWASLAARITELAEALRNR